MTTTDRAPKGAYDALRAAMARGDAWETTDGWTVIAPAEGNLQREVRFPTRRMAAEAALACDACDETQALFRAAHVRAAQEWPVTSGEEGHGDGRMVSVAAMMAAAEEIEIGDADLGSFLRSAAEGADRPAPIGAIWDSVAAWISSHAR